MNSAPLVHVRTPTYRRPDMLRRALQSLVDQTWSNWVCDIYDDDPEASGRAVCEDFADPRIHYNHNRPQLFASKNIDRCFSSGNPHDAVFFCVVEDDNQLLSSFMEENIELCRRNGVEIVFRNQLIEYDSGTPQAKIGELGILDRSFKEGIYPPEEFRLSLLPGIGISNGGVFWTSSATSNLEIRYDCTATLQEYMRTFAISDPIYVAMQPLAVWALNGEQTTRDIGNAASYLRRELDLKRSIQILQKEAWRRARDDVRREFLKSNRFAFDPSQRARGLVKGLVTLRVGSALAVRDRLMLLARGLLIRVAGRANPDLLKFVRQRG